MDANDESASSRASPVLPIDSFESDGEYMSQSVSTGSIRNHTSAVWVHYKRIVVNGEAHAKCVYCDQLLSAGSQNETSHLKDHVEKRCSRKNKKIDIRQKLLSVSGKAYGSGVATVNSTYFSQEMSMKELANMVILHEFPLATVDHIGFRRFVSSLNPNFKIISRNTLRSDIMKMYTSEKTSLKKVLESNPSKIAITTAMWTTSNQKRCYMVVTAHYIDQLWVLHDKTLRFAYVPCPHTKDTLAQVLLDTLNGYNIAEKISAVVVDNCSTNEAMLDILKPRLGEESLLLKGRFHMRCIAHILNLIVQDGLSVIGEGIERIRDCVSFWVATPQRIEMFEDTVKSMKGEEAKKLFLDCQTRWNSTFFMLQTVLPYKDVFASIKRLSPCLKFNLPTQEDWTLALLVCKKLKKFHKLTKLFSGQRYPTSNLFFRPLCEIKLALDSWLQSETQVIKDMVEQMVEKFNKYWKTVNEVLAIAAILDPRDKLECVEFYFNEIYGERADLEIQRVKATLYELLYEYHDRFLLSEDNSFTTTQSSFLGGVDGNKLDDKWSRVKKTKRRKVNVKSELDRYLEEDVLPECDNFDILKYWNVVLKYPTLQRIAKDILAIPASTVASESAFSMSGRVVSPHRSRLATSTVEALMCMQNWILGDFTSDTSLHTMKARATILEDHDTVDDAGGDVIDLDSGDEDDMDFI